VLRRRPIEQRNLVAIDWLDNEDWEAWLERLVEKGRPLRDLYQPLRKFGLNGYTIFRHRIPDGIIDRINDDLESFWQSPRAR
jgi:hypothetical protein